jgi:hypothetical protein
MYHEMLATLLEEEGVAYAGIAMALLYRGPRTPGAAHPVEEEAAQVEAQRAAAEQYFGTRDALLDVVADPQSYRSAVRELVTDRQSTAAQVAAAEFATIPYHLTYKCDGCLYNEFCMKWSAERDDLSLLPHLTAPDKSALQHAGISTVRELATLKEPRQAETAESAADAGDLVPAPGKEALVRKLATTRSVRPRLDELVHRSCPTLSPLEGGCARGALLHHEETFAHAQLWKTLRRRTCTVQLWARPRDGWHVEVWGN